MLEKYNYKARVIDAYDGDTITVEIDLGFDITHIIKIRLARINAPEVRGAEKIAGIIARDWLRVNMVGKSVEVKTYKDKREKYGRYLADVFYYLPTSESGWENDAVVCVNDELVKQKLAIYKDY